MFLCRANILRLISVILLVFYLVGCKDFNKTFTNTIDPPCTVTKLQVSLRITGTGNIFPEVKKWYNNNNPAEINNVVPDFFKLIWNVNLETGQSIHLGASFVDDQEITFNEVIFLAGCNSESSGGASIIARPKPCQCLVLDVYNGSSVPGAITLESLEWTASHDPIPLDNLIWGDTLLESLTWVSVTDNLPIDLLPEDPPLTFDIPESQLEGYNYSLFRSIVSTPLGEIVQEAVYQSAINTITTLIDLVSFTATDVDGEVPLEWVTASEIDNAGFYIWRKEGETGEYVQINGSLIPAEGTPTAGAYYSYTDNTIVDGNTYYYRLEDVDIYGTSTFHDTDPVIFAALGGSESDTESASAGAGSGKCFIATAAFGSYLDPHVKVLREFRDGYLLTNGPGRAFVDTYYTYSPPLANFISAHVILRAVTRVLLLPIVGVGAFMVKTTLMMKMVSLGLLMITISFFAMKRRRKVKG